MGRIICIDYGVKRTGLAVTDSLQIIASALATIETPKLMAFLQDYTSKEQVSLFLVGYPLNLDDSFTHATQAVENFIKKLAKQFPNIPIQKADERFTSKLAVQAMVQMGMKKKERQKKENIDQIAATIMLQEYLQNK
jgi:putative Holliday junction resolvase